MNIKIIDSWLREYLETNAKPEEIAHALSLTSVSVDKLEKVKDEYIYDIEVTTNRPDLMSVAGIAKEASAALNEEGKKAVFIDKKLDQFTSPDISFPIEIINDSTLVNRIMTVILEVNIGKSPSKLSNRLELSGIRSLNNLIDVTNYVMRETGHPTHVFDYDRLNSKKLIIRQSKKGENLITLDNKKYSLTGGDIVAVNEKDEIVDLLGVMGTANSVVTESTKRIMFFLDNLNPGHIRNTSMNLGIRTEAAIINEKGIDTKLTEKAFMFGINLYKEIANAKIITKTLDIYPNKPNAKNIKVSVPQINSVVGVEIEAKKSIAILNELGFSVELRGENLEVKVPPSRLNDVNMQIDIIEEIARVYGYHKLPSKVPGFRNNKKRNYTNEFYIENRVKNALKYWGFTEVYTYSLISEEMFLGPIKDALKLKNPLTEDMIYLRNTLIPSLLKVLEENKDKKEIKIFELSNVYLRKEGELPNEKLMLAGVIKKENSNFFEVKGVVEQLLLDLGIKSAKFKNRDESGANIFIDKELLGYIEILNADLINFELNFEIILKLADFKKTYKKLTKFPPIIEDMTFILDSGINTEDVIEEIKLQSFLINEVNLKDQYEDTKTFHIIYQSSDKNLTTSETAEIRNQITIALEKKFGAKVK